MPDVEKVIMGLEWALENMVDPINDFRFAGYDGPCVLLNQPIVSDALALLKAQEPVKPIENAGFYYCGACRYVFTSARQKYCFECGRKVKWE